MRTLTPSHDLIKLYECKPQIFSLILSETIEELRWQHLYALSLVQFNADRLSNDPDPAQFMTMLNEILKHIERQP